MIKPKDPATLLPSVGPKISQKLKNLEIDTVNNLLKHYPTRYLDLTQTFTISKLEEKKYSGIKAEITNLKQFRSRAGKLITEAVATDSTGKIPLIWFNSPYISKSIITNTKYLIAGKPSYFAGKLTLIAPQIEIASNNSLHTSGLVPIYPQTSGINSKYLRRLIALTLKLTSITDPVPKNIIIKNKLPSFKIALKNIHFPQNKLNYLNADKRLSFNEHLSINLKNQLESKNYGNAPKIKISQEINSKIKKKLPFKLTTDQEKAIKKLYQNISKITPSHTLIQGDTGSGKTVLAIFTAAQTINNHLSFCLLAPTQILAEQHYQTFKKYTDPKTNIIFVTGKSPLKKSPNTPTIFIGTHALLRQIPDKINYPIGLVFIDEQHKFGVKQREQLQKRQPQPHLVNMTATPIPRTLALGLFGEISITTIKNKPNNRLPIKTWIITEKRFQNSFSWLKQKIEADQKIFVVCPFIEESKTNSTIKSATKIHHFYQKLFGHLTTVSLIHGRLKPEEKTKTLEDFQSQKSHLLISTPIIEVGIDIPQANIIIIHSAERFGLAQLHQLRGRVGRGHEQGYCLLIPTNEEQTETERLNLLTKHNNGLTLAKLDLKLRGTGEIAGIKQHGRFSVRLKYFWNRSLFQTAKKISSLLLKKNPSQAKIIAQQLSDW